VTQGGCFCGAIRYAIDDGNYLVANCHCSMCRRTSAAPYVTWMVVPTIAFGYTKGSPTKLLSSEQGTRYFCSNCGTPVACVISSNPGEIDVTIGSLDNPEEFPPTLDVHEDTKLPWLSHAETQV